MTSLAKKAKGVTAVDGLYRSVRKTTITSSSASFSSISRWARSRTRMSGRLTCIAECLTTRFAARTTIRRPALFSAADLLKRDKANLDITWLRAKGDETDDRTLGEIFGEIKSRSERLSKSVASLERLLKGIEE